MRLMRLVLALLCLGAAPVAVPVAAAPYVIDHDHSSITFSASHLGYSVFHGRFRTWSGTIDFVPDDIEASQVRIEIDAASFDTGSKIRDDNTMIFPDMLNVKAFAKIVFVSKRIDLTSAETVRMTGDLTVRDLTREVTFDVRLNARGITPISRGKEVFGFTATGNFDRVAFGIGFAAPAVSGVVPVRIDIEIMPAN
jgi:polyisoprenoid-binding protein YceI